MIENLVPGLYSLMPGTKTIRYFKRAPGDDWDSGVQVAGAEKRPLNAQQQAIAGIDLGVTAGVWHVWRERLGGLTPEQGDKLEFDGETWHVKRVDEELLGQRFKLTCVKQR